MDSSNFEQDFKSWGTIILDRELLILENIQKNNDISQRQLSNILGISLGSVNTLLKKMKREGFIKVKKVPSNRVAYMLTPEGVVEKANKTYNYIKIHYNYINDTKNRMIERFLEDLHTYNKVYILVSDHEMTEIVKSAISEIKSEDIVIINSENEIDSNNYILYTINNSYKENLESNVKDLLEII